MDSRPLGERFNEALSYAADLHAHQTRKGSDIPYVSHLMSVASLVLEHGGDEEQAIAALLHDAAEDQGGLETLRDIERRFGVRVARIVDACSDSHGEPRPPWRERKEHYLRHLREEVPQDALLVSMADKLHNARSILLDFRRHGDGLWSRFTADRDGVLWYYRSLVETYADRVRSPLLDELERTLSEIERLATT
ncbi:MAG: HD domain-containing protein [Myxococcota bacterium]